MELEHNTWYWISHPQEGDIFYPVLVVNDKYLMMDGKHHLIEDNKGANFEKAVMPETA